MSSSQGYLNATGVVEGALYEVYLENRSHWLLKGTLNASSVVHSLADRNIVGTNYYYYYYYYYYYTDW